MRTFDFVAILEEIHFMTTLIVNGHLMECTLARCTVSEPDINAVSCQEETITYESNRKCARAPPATHASTCC
jgi:hypothetical protein